MNLYYPLWKKYLTIIQVQMKNAANGEKEIKMLKSDFENYGNRVVSDYYFNLEIKNGKVFNNISGTAVARDLYDVLLADSVCKKLLVDTFYKFSLGKEFVLRVSIK